MKQVVKVSLVLLALGMGGGPQRADAEITISPEHPTTQDSVRVAVWALYPHACWTAPGHQCTFGTPETLAVTMDVQYCGGNRSCECATIPIALHATCNYGLLPAGTYTAVFTTNRLNPYDIAPATRESAQFTVRAFLPAVPCSWGKLKAIYR